MRKFKKTIRITRYGPLVILWNEIKNDAAISRILLSKPADPATARADRLFPDVHEDSCSKIDSIALDICDFLEGKPIDFSLDSVNLCSCSEFQQRVLRAEYAIPRGRVSSYRSIARYLGRAGGARAVGNALATNPFPLIVPCHRAIRSDGSLGGYQGGLEMKRALLENEGIRFDRSGRVDCFRYYYD